MGGDYFPSFTLRMSEEVIEKLKVLAARERRSANRQIAVVLEQYIAQYEAEHGEIEVDPLA